MDPKAYRYELAYEARTEGGGRRLVVEPGDFESKSAAAFNGVAVDNNVNPRLVLMQRAPMEWVEYQSVDYGRPYFINTRTNETQWTVRLACGLVV